MKNRFRLLFEDDRCSGKEAAAIARKFFDVDHVKYVLGYACSGSARGAAPSLEEIRTITIISAAASPAISRAGDYIFRTFPSSSAAAPLLFEYIRRHYRKLAMLYEETDYPRDVLRLRGSRPDVLFIDTIQRCAQASC